MAEQPYQLVTPRYTPAAQQTADPIRTMPATDQPSSRPRAAMRRLRALWPNLVLAMVSASLTFIAAELVFRWLLFDTDLLPASQRKPGLYADYTWDDDYWKLEYLWKKFYPTPAKPHPLLGWVASADHDTLVHDEADLVGNRRPVLLYGDSFAQSVPTVTSFDPLLNQDPSFSQGHYLLNYGCGGYGLDQILLLMENSLDHYDDPYVVFSFLTYDIDRSMLSVRTGQKPHFELIDDRLELHGLPIDPNPDHFFTTHPPAIPSYLFRRLLFFPGKQPGRIASRIRNEAQKRRDKKRLNERLLARAFDALEKRGLDFSVLLFVPERTMRGRADWRDPWLERHLRATGHDLIVARDVLRYRAPSTAVDEFFVEGNGHPTTFYNQLIADEISRRVLGAMNPE